MDKEGLKKELEYLIMSKNHIWTAILGSFGGTVGLVFINTTLFWIKLSFVFCGFLFTLFFLENYFRKDDKIEKIIELLKYGGKK